MTSAIGKRGLRAGFTLLELIVVIALIMVIAGIGVMSFDGFGEKKLVQQPADALALMVKQASRASVVQGRPVVIGFDKKGFRFLEQVMEGTEGSFTVPKEMKIFVKRWNGGSRWVEADGLNWTFYATGISEALRFKFEHPEGVAEIAFNPLTGSVTEESIITR